MLMNSVLQAQQTAFKEQREKFNEEATALEEQIERARQEYEAFVQGVNTSSQSTQHPGTNILTHILTEAKKFYDGVFKDGSATDDNRLHLAKSYYTVYYDLACKENATHGRSVITDQELSEARARVERLQGEQDKERINLLHQLQNLAYAKEVIAATESQIREKAQGMRQNLKDMELRRAFEGLLSLVEATGRVYHPQKLKCFISYAWPEDQPTIDKLQVGVSYH
jgi:predicted  nucleic acid-binding Zn-ribbon protein